VNIEIRGERIFCKILEFPPSKKDYEFGLLGWMAPQRWLFDTVKEKSIDVVLSFTDVLLFFILYFEERSPPHTTITTTTANVRKREIATS
jgi:hypothetical protein